MHGQGALSNISTKDKGLPSMKGREPCYQNYFRNQVLFHFSIELIPILPTNAVRGDVLFVVLGSAINEYNLHSALLDERFLN